MTKRAKLGRASYKVDHRDVGNGNQHTNKKCGDVSLLSNMVLGSMVRPCSGTHLST
jgi:hypothetical protein